MLAAQNQSAGLRFGILSMDPFPPPIWLFRDKFLGLELYWFLKRTTPASSPLLSLLFFSFSPTTSSALLTVMLPLDSGRTKWPLKDIPKDTAHPLVSGSPYSAVFVFLKFSSVDQAQLNFKDKYWAQKWHREGRGAWELGCEHLSAETDFLCS